MKNHNYRNKLQLWMLNYLTQRLVACYPETKVTPTHIFLCICDHFEPLRGNVSDKTGLEIVKRWVRIYPEISKRFLDSDGCHPKYTFFYPAEEYRKEYLDLLAKLKNDGLGEVEVHLHHNNDTSENLNSVLRDYSQRLFNEHGLLSNDTKTNKISYGFIHGNWALDNSGFDGECCGVNNEIDILGETGCYADFTMPSAPHYTQTLKINSIYYAIDDPKKPKSHNWGRDAQVSHPQAQENGLLMVQGPLMLNWVNRKWGFLPRIENGCLAHNSPVSLLRIRLWLQANIHILGKPGYIFIKIYTHGCVEQNMNYLLTNGLNDVFSLFKNNCDNESSRIHFVSAREMVNIIKAIEDGNSDKDISALKNYRFV